MSFTSFVEFPAGECGGETSGAGEGGEEAEEEEDFLEGELISSVPCENVILFSAFGDGSGAGGAGGCLGKLLTTNFRLSFRPAASAMRVGRGRGSQRRSRVMDDDHDLPLVSIQDILVTTLAEKRMRRLTTPLSGMEQVCEVKLVTGDLRSRHFSFRQSQFAGQLVNQIVHFSRPAKLSGLLSVRLRERLRQDPRVPSFNSHRGWEAELGRTGAGTQGWRVCRFNSRHALVPSYPESLVVPASLTDAELVKAAEVWELRRIPVWVWSSPSGSALLRSSQLPASATAWAQDRRDAVHRAIRASHPGNRPSAELSVPFGRKEVQESYTALRKLLALSSWSEFNADEDSSPPGKAAWYSRLEQSGWPNLVASALRCAGDAVRLMESGESVVVTEAQGQDISAVVSSLAQLCLDPYYRSLEGLGWLVQKEWSALGHPFGLRLFGLSVEGRRDEERAPVFLLFLECVWQLGRAQPDALGFSQHYLIALWDLALSGLTLSLATNAARDRHVLAQSLGPTWAPELYFAHTYRHQLFPSALASLRKTASELGGQHLAIPRRGQTLAPPASVADLHLWEALWLRWTVPAHFLGGGDNQELLALRLLETELRRLQALKTDAAPPRPPRIPSAAQLPSGWPYLLHTAPLVPRDAVVKGGLGPDERLRRRASFSGLPSRVDAGSASPAKPSHLALLNRTTGLILEEGGAAGRDVPNGRPLRKGSAQLGVPELSRAPSRAPRRLDAPPEAPRASAPAALGRGPKPALPPRRAILRYDSGGHAGTAGCGRGGAPASPLASAESLEDESPTEGRVPALPGQPPLRLSRRQGPDDAPARFTGKTEAQLKREAKASNFSTLV